MTDARIEWRIDAANSAVVRGVHYAWVGLLGGFALFAFASLGAGALDAAADGEFAPLAFLVLLVLVGGPFSVLYLLPVLRDPDRWAVLARFVPDPADDPAESTAERYAAAFSVRGALAAAVLGALAVPALAAVDARLLVALALFLFAAMVLSSGLTTWGRLSPAEPRLEYRTTTVPLEAIADTRRFDLGKLVVYRVSYRSGERTLATPTVLVFTPEAARAFERVLERVDPVEPTTSSNRAVTAVAIAIGVAFLAFSVGVVLVDAVPLGVGLYLATFTGLLGALFVWAALALS